MLTIVRSGNWLPAALTLCLAALPVFAAPPSGAGGSKVTVTAANPPDAFQGEELDVIVSGSGFDQGSQVSYLVTGTTDASQVEVISVQYISSSELKTRIRPKDAALPTEYDIQVQTSSGRKGKGTTLFRVKVAETACMGDEPKEPTIAYVTATDTTGEIYTADLYLASDSGCDQYLLMEDAQEVLPESPDTNPNRCIHCVTWLRLATRGNTGVATWVDENRSYWGQSGMMFEFDSAGNIVPLSANPVLFYLPTEGSQVWGTDVRFNSAGEVELAFLERTADAIDRWLIVYNDSTDVREELLQPGCPVQDDSGTCLEVTWPVFWSKVSNEIFFSVFEPVSDASVVDEKRGIARISRENGAWGEPELLMINQGSLHFQSTSSTNELVFDYEEVLYTRSGKVKGFRESFGVIPSAYCDPFVCSVFDGTDLLIDRTGRGPLVLTPDGRALVYYYGNNSDRPGYIQEYIDPFTGAPGKILIQGTDGRFDTSY